MAFFFGSDTNILESQVANGRKKANKELYITLDYFI